MNAKVKLLTDLAFTGPTRGIFQRDINAESTMKKITTVAGEYVEVMLKNVNAERIGKLTAEDTNEFGSISGSFKLPKSGLNGNYTYWWPKKIMRKAENSITRDR